MHLENIYIFILIILCSSLSSSRALRIFRLKASINRELMTSSSTILKESIKENGIIFDATKVDSENEENFEIVEPVKDAQKNVDQTASGKFSLQKLLIVFASISLGAGFGLYQHSTTPRTNLALLHLMEKESVDIRAAACNHKPTVVEFYADWCESCKRTAPTVRALEYKYGDRINFVTLNGMMPQNSQWISKFGVDGIPHFAFLNGDAVVQTALVGEVPQSILDAEMSALAKGDRELPYEGYDAFQGRDPHPISTTSCSTTF